jgi:drug/metabolite transporter, DME family
VNRNPGAPNLSQGVDRLALAAGLVAPLTWGLTGIFVRLLHGVPTLGIVAGRLLIAALVLVPWAFARRRDLLAACRTPLSFIMGAYYVFATEAFARVAVIEVVLVIGSAPVIAMGLERCRGTRPARQQIAGAIIALLGLVLFLHPRSTIGTQRMIGYLFAFGAAAASAAYAVGLRARANANRPLDALALTVVACAIGAAVSFGLLACEMPIELGVNSSPELVYMVLLGVLSTAVPTLAFGVASLRLPPVLTTSLGLTTPLFAAFYAGWALDEWPAPSAIPGALLTLAGILLVLRSKATDPRTPDTCPNDISK